MPDERKTWYIEEKEKTGHQIYYKGQMIHNALQFPFVCYDTPNGKGDLRAIIHVISPNTNKRMMYEGKNLRERMERLSEKEKEDFRAGKQIEKLCIAKEVIINLPRNRGSGIRTVSQSNEREIKRAIEKAVISLYGDNHSQFTKALRESGKGGCLHASAAYDAYSKTYFAGQTCSAKTLKEKKDALKKLCAALDEYPMDAIPAKTVASAYAMTKSKQVWKFNILEDFFTFCQGKGLYKGENPISQFLQTRPGKDDKTAADAAARRALIPRVLPLDVEKKMVETLYAQIDNPAVLSVALAAGADAGIEEMRELRCSDIIVNEKGEMIIRLFKRENTGATHNFSRPPLPAYRDLILARLAYLKDRYKEEKIQRMYLVPSDNSGESPMPASKITTYLRTTLLHAGIDYSKLAACVADGRHKLGGAGLKLLQDHYETILREECGVDLSSGIGHFLCGKAIFDTTTDSYRSLISEDGKHVLQGLIRRDAHLCTEELDRELKPVIWEDGEKIIVDLPAAGLGNLTGGLIPIKMHAGERLSVITTQESNEVSYIGYGFSGDITADISNGERTRHVREEW